MNILKLDPSFLLNLKIGCTIIKILLCEAVTWISCVSPESVVRYDHLQCVTWIYTSTAPRSRKRSLSFSSSSSEKSSKMIPPLWCPPRKRWWCCSHSLSQPMLGGTWLPGQLLMVMTGRGAGRGRDFTTLLCGVSLKQDWSFLKGASHQSLFRDTSP